MHGSILAVTTPAPPPTPLQAHLWEKPALLARGWGIFSSGLVLGVGGGENQSNYSSKEL